MTSRDESVHTPRVPELPDLEVYAEHLTARLAGRKLLSTRILSPFVLRTFEPPPEAAAGSALQRVDRYGKRLVFHWQVGLCFVLHLMRSGRLRWTPPGTRVPRRGALAVLDFEHGSLLFTEAATKRRASLHVVRATEVKERFARGGVEPLLASLEQFSTALKRENRTLKRALTDQGIIMGIGNAYSDEILHAARLSPAKRTYALEPGESKRLWEAMRRVLSEWTARLRVLSGDGFPDHVTAFRAGMAVHGRFGQPCPDCSSPVQRVRYAESECNYCAKCQTAGKLLADRSLSRLLRGDWPKTLDALEERRAATPMHAKQRSRSEVATSKRHSSDFAPTPRQRK